MKITGLIANDCPNGKSCPRIHDTDGADVIVQGTTVTDPDLLAQVDADMPATESAVQVPRTLLDEAHLMVDDEFEEWFDAHHTRDLLRVENRPEYLVASDGGDFQRFQQGRALTSPEHMSWLEYLDGDLRAGKAWRRVRLFHDHPGDYGLYECHAFVDSTAHGEEIRVLEPELPDLVDVPDFFVLDGRHVLRSVYDEVGRHLGGIVVTGPDAAVYRSLAQGLWAAGENFATWWDKHPQYHRALRAA